MKIIFDVDGTLTDFNKFVEKNAYPYFKSKYGMNVKYPNKLEIQDIFDMDNFFKEKYNYDLSKAKIMTQRALDKFWIGLRFIKFSIFSKFRPGVKKYIKEKIKEGHNIEIHTSRAKTTDNGIIGYIARKFTILQFRINGIPLSSKKFHFYKDDNDKINGIINSCPNLVFDDKVDTINNLAEKNISVICVNGNHNKDVNESNRISKIDNFDFEKLNDKVEKLVGQVNIKYFNRAAESDKVFKKVKLCQPIIMKKFKPIVIGNKSYDFHDKAVIYAPNHRSTLDPVILTGIVLKNIHWAALLRFFEGKDSIFNNNKNFILCKVTSKLFKKMEYFPIDRKSDNSNANNFIAVKDMKNFLKINQCVGIFPEGTTRRPEGQDFGTFDDSFILLSKRTDSWIQPITTLWIKDIPVKQKVIVNFGQPFKATNMSIEEAMNLFLSIQKKGLQENQIIEQQLKDNCEAKKKALKKF